jgi:hypothetical protein
MSAGRFPDYGDSDEPERFPPPPPHYRPRPRRTARQLVSFVLISVLAVSGLLFIALAVFFVLMLNNLGSNK